MRMKLTLQALAGLLVVFLVGLVAHGSKNDLKADQQTQIRHLAQASAAGRMNPIKGPRVRFEKREHDFGTADSGAALKTSFVFRNVGDEVLVIERVSGG